MIGGGWADNRPTHPNHKNGLSKTNNKYWRDNGISQHIITVVSLMSRKVCQVNIIFLGYILKVEDARHVILVKQGFNECMSFVYT